MASADGKVVEEEGVEEDVVEIKEKLLRVSPVMASADGKVVEEEGVEEDVVEIKEKLLRVSPVMASADGKVVEEEGVEDDVVEIKEKPLDIMRYIDAVRDSSVGAIATFSGTTRDTFEGQEVLELRYEAYETMAYRELKRICQAARERWELKRMAVAHRTGVVPIGQESVFIAISSIHRQDALKACQFVIDEIKASVPIWKKEIYNNGESWKQNSEFLTRNTT